MDTDESALITVMLLYKFDKLVNICNPDFRDFNGNNMIIKSACKSGPSYDSTYYKISGMGYEQGPTVDGITGLPVNN